MSRPSARRKKLFVKTYARYLAVYGAMLSVVAAGLFAYTKVGRETVRSAVTDKERIVQGSGQDTTSKYLVHTDGEVFENTDSVFHLKFRSSDIQGQLQRGCTYDFNVYGLRNGFMSMYRNIVDVRHVPTAECPDPKLLRARAP